MDKKEWLLTLKGKEDVTLDGHHMMLYANIEAPGILRWCEKRRGQPAYTNVIEMEILC